MANVSPSFFFHEAIPPSVIVGLMAGMLNRERAFRRADTWKPINQNELGQFANLRRSLRRVKMRVATTEAMTDEGHPKTAGRIFVLWGGVRKPNNAKASPGRADHVAY